MTDPLLRALEDELGHLRELRGAVLQVLSDSSLSPEDKVKAIERVFQAERDQDEESEEARDSERLS
jgi:hypothetical protein